MRKKAQVNNGAKHKSQKKPKGKKKPLKESPGKLVNAFSICGLFRQNPNGTGNGNGTIGLLYIMWNVSHYKGKGNGTLQGERYKWVSKPFSLFSIKGKVLCN